MTRAVIAQVASVSSLGKDLPELWQALLMGHSGIAPLERFECSGFVSQQAACIDDLQAPNDGSLLDTILERVAAQFGPLPEETRLFLASTKGEIDCLTTSRRQRQSIPSTVLFEPLLSKVSKRFGVVDDGCNINAACASSTIAVARAAAMIEAGAAESVLVYAVDIVSEFVFSGFSALRALSPEPCRPFDQRRDGLTLGEAGVAILVMSEQQAMIKAMQPYAYISGWGAGNDAHHVTAPARDGSGLIRACQQAFRKADVASDQIAAINAHGTGTVFNDAMELTAFNAVFGQNLPPIHGVKGALGHCLGAAGALEIAVGCLALRDRTLPGTVGCEVPEDVGQGRVNNAPQEISGDYLLCCNSGFGGINGAVVLQRASQ